MESSSQTADMHPLAFAPLHVWLRLIRANGGVSRAYWGRLAKIILGSAVTSPLRVAETLRYGRRTARTELEVPPLHVLGYARAGTTHLHNLLATDPNHGFIPTLQAMFAGFFLTVNNWEWLRQAIAKNMPATRPMDNVALSLDAPQEEETAIATSSHMSYILYLSFPAQQMNCFNRYAMMRGLSGRELEQWERAYMNVVRKAAIAANGRRIVLKSPPNLSKVPHLLRLMPDSKFVFIMRNPYVVYDSLLKTNRSVLPIFQVADYDLAEVEALIRSTYAESMRRYLEDRSLIPPGNLTEVRLEDLVEDPMGELERIYSELSLPDWEQAQGHIATYLRTLSGYRQNPHRLDQSTIDLVSRDWGFVVEHWGYAPPGSD